MPQAHRYAIYLSPPSPFREIGSQWLGRCADTGAALTRRPDDDPRLDAWTAAPAHYGLHATLKPPFRLAPGATPASLDMAMRLFARGRAPFAVTLVLRELRGFLAWCLGEAAGDRDANAHMHALADAAVQQMDVFRAPATPEELARRLQSGLTAHEQRMLESWGYPYVFDTFAFHITLTGQLDAPELAAAVARIEAQAATLRDAPMVVDAVSVFAQAEAGADFVAARHYRFDGTTVDGAAADSLDGTP